MTRSIVRIGIAALTAVLVGAVAAAIQQEF